ncbi:MAG: Hsp20/alpha crystallin family protein [Verrucomicrobiia bacterium]
MRLMRWRRPDAGNWGLDQWTNLRDEINRLFDVPFGDLNRDSEFFGWAPAVDVYEDKDSLVVQAELPGMKKEDIELSFHEGCLILSGERKLESENGDGESSRSERFFGRFQRSIELPKRVDANAASATYRDGILTVRLPKAEEAKPKQITVKAS